MGNKYSLEWFKKRAAESLKPVGSGMWDYSDSLLLYLPDAEKEYEDIQKDGDPYYSLVTEPETKYISEIADKVTSELPNNFYYIDLGPGTENKEKFFFDSLEKQKKNFTYFPVDINRHFLESAKKFADQRKIKTIPIQSSFEECVQFLPAEDNYRFVSIGLTFVNYHIQDVLIFLDKTIGTRGSAFINTHIR